MLNEKYNRLYIGPVAAEIFSLLGFNSKLLTVGTEHIYLHPAIHRLEVDLGGYCPFVVDLHRDRR